MKKDKQLKRKRRQARSRAKMAGTPERPRLAVYRSLKRNYAQLFDDSAGKILAAANDSAFMKEGKKIERAKKVGLELAKKALEKGISSCVFDRSGYQYHGRVKAIADGAREGGLKF